MVGVKPAIAQLVEHLTVELAEIRWSGRICLTPYVDQKLADVFCSVVSTSMSLLWDSSPRPPV